MFWYFRKWIYNDCYKFIVSYRRETLELNMLLTKPIAKLSLQWNSCFCHLLERLKNIIINNIFINYIIIIKLNDYYKLYVDRIKLIIRSLTKHFGIYYLFSKDSYFRVYQVNPFLNYLILATLFSYRVT